MDTISHFLSNEPFSCECKFLDSSRFSENGIRGKWGKSDGMELISLEIFIGELNFYNILQQW